MFGTPTAHVRLHSYFAPLFLAQNLVYQLCHVGNRNLSVTVHVVTVLAVHLDDTSFEHLRCPTFIDVGLTGAMGNIEDARGRDVGESIFAESKGFTNVRYYFGKIRATIKSKSTNISYRGWYLNTCEIFHIIESIVVNDFNAIRDVSVPASCQQ